MKFKQHSYLTVGENKGRKRVWLQGLKLEEAGFTKGVPYRVDYDIDSGFIELSLDEHGNRSVSGRSKDSKVTPIVEICNSTLIEVTHDAEKVRVDFSVGYIRISIHHHISKQAEREQRLLDNLKKGVIKEGSVCTGGGVASLAVKQGFKENGIKSSLEWVVDRERKYLQVACDNNPVITEDTVLFEASLEELEPELLSPVDFLQFSLSCCPHGKQGKAKNKNKIAESHKTDATGVLGFMRTVEAVNPSVLLSENVIPAKNSATYELIKGMLRLLGYVIHEIDLNGEQAGTIENRNRYWFIAVSSGLPHLDLKQLPFYKRVYEKLGDVLEPVAEDDDSWSDNTYLKTKALKDKLAGKNFKRELVNEDTTSVKCIGRGYARKRSTECYLVREDGKERLLTPVEHARVKGVPEYLISGVPKTTAHEVLGQSILFSNCKGLSSLVALSVFNPMLSPNFNFQSENYKKLDYQLQYDLF